MRHWKQHWDPKAELVAKRRLRMGDDPKKPFVMPGEIISQAQREKLGLNRLRRWFENGTLEQADFKPVEAQRRLALGGEAYDALQEQKRESALATMDRSGGLTMVNPKAEKEDAGLDTVEKMVDEVIEPKSYIRDESGKVEVFEPERKGAIVPDLADQKRLERNAKAKATRAANKVAKAKRDERNRKAREKRAAARVNAGE